MYGPTKAQLLVELEEMRNALADAIALAREMLPYVTEWNPSYTEDIEAKIDDLVQVQAA